MLLSVGVTGARLRATEMGDIASHDMDQYLQRFQSCVIIDMSPYGGGKHCDALGIRYSKALNSPDALRAMQQCYSKS